MLDQALVGSLVTGLMALASQIVSKARCYTACKKGNMHVMVCGFIETVGFRRHHVDNNDHIQFLFLPRVHRRQRKRASRQINFILILPSFPDLASSPGTLIQV